MKSLKIGNISGAITVALGITLYTFLGITAKEEPINILVGGYVLSFIAGYIIATSVTYIGCYIERNKDGQS